MALNEGEQAGTLSGGDQVPDAAAVGTRRAGDPLPAGDLAASVCAAVSARGIQVVRVHRDPKENGRSTGFPVLRP